MTDSDDLPPALPDEKAEAYRRRVSRVEGVPVLATIKRTARLAAALKMLVAVVAAFGGAAWTAARFVWEHQQHEHQTDALLLRIEANQAESARAVAASLADVNDRMSRLVAQCPRGPWLRIGPVCPVGPRR